TSTSSTTSTTVLNCSSYYRTLVLLMSQSPHDTSYALSTLDDLAADVARMSYDRVCLSYDIRTYQATATEIGCTGAGSDMIAIASYGVGRSIADGLDTSNVEHVILMANSDLQPGCFVGGAQGGKYSFPGMQPETGVVLFGFWGT